MKWSKKLIYFCTAAVLLVSVLVPVAAASTAVQAAPTTSPVVIDGIEMKFEAYCIYGSNYFKLRDVAYALRDTSKPFQVTFDDALGRVVLTSGTNYTPAGGELTVSGFPAPVNATRASFEVYLDGAKLTMTSYIIGDSNYIKLRELAAAINFGVNYLSESNTIQIDTSAGYIPVQAISFPSDLNVTFIGDSVGAGVAPYLKKYFPNMFIDAKASRQFYQAKSIIEKLLQEDKLSPTVVIGLGTNGTVKEADMRALIELIGSDRKIVFVNCRVPRSWGLADNKMFAQVTAEFPNTIIADWYGASAENDQYFYQDGFHPNKAGCTVLAKTIAEAVAEIQAYQPIVPYIPYVPYTP